MKKSFIFILGILFCIPISYCQTGIRNITENFDNPNSITLTGTPAKGWRIDNNYYVSFPNSYRGIVPNAIRDSIVLQTPPYDFTGVYYVIMSFDHICKISPTDTLRIEYRITGQSWKNIPVGSYLSSAINYASAGFSAASYYHQWQANDSTAIPDQSWWKEEVFDVSSLVSNAPSVEFRFVLKRGFAEGTQAAYGWLIDNFNLLLSPHELRAPTVEFISPFVDDTVYYTGPWEVNAKVKTRTAARIANPWLVYTVTNNTGIKTDSVLMTNIAGDSLWKASIPRLTAGSEVRYSITGRDTTGNQAADTSYYYIKQPEKSVTGYVTIGTGTSSDYNCPINFWSNYNWSRQLYFADEFDQSSRGGLITRLAWQYARTASFINTNQTCYFRVVDDDSVTNTRYEDPLATGAIQVWKGTLSASTSGWVEIILDTPFELPPGKNLLVYWHNQSGRMYDDYISNVWRYTNTSVNSTAHAFADNNFPTTGNAVLVQGRPNARFYIIGNRLDTNSVALLSIDNPTKGSITGGTPNPLVITIQNKGIANLDSAVVYWTVNGGDIDSAVWRGNLPWGFKQQDTIGYFTPDANKFDTLTLWVSLPNRQVDSTTHDDTLTTILYGCSQPLPGTQHIGNSDKLEEVLQMIRDCGVNTNIILELETGTYKNIDFTDISIPLGGHSLTVTSASGNAEDVIIRPSSGAGIVLNNSNNITLKDITVDARTSKLYAIHFTGACTNVVIRDCRLLGDTVTTSTAHTVIHKASSTGVVDSIFFLNNLIEGGYYGFYFYGGTTDNYGTHVVFDSNTVSHWHYSGINSYCTDFISCSYNAVLSRTVEAFWMPYPFRISYANGPIISNRIIQRSDEISSPHSFYLEEYNSNFATGKGLVANNEIIATVWGSYYGMYIGANTNADIIHNSILVRGDGGRAVYIEDSPGTNLTVKKNNIVMEGETSNPVYLSGITSLNQWDFDYNNYYAPVYVGSIFMVANFATLKDWQYIVTSDRNSVSISPQFVNTENDLRFSNYVDLLCKNIPSVNTDILGNQRMDITTMGCYEDIPISTTNGMLLNLSGFGNNATPGQSDSLKVIVFNSGTTHINSLNIEWSVNGNSHIAGGYNFTTSLAKGQADTIFIGEIMYRPGNMNVEVWINNLNGLNIDEIKGDDTLKVSHFVCGGLLRGKLIIADTTDYSSVTTALNIITQCGISGDITFVLDPGIYVDNIDLTDIGNLLGNYSLTITSRTGNANDVVIKPASSSQSAIRLNNSNNIILKDITVNIGANETYGIEFTGACTNVIVRDCRILADTITPYLYATPIYKGTTGIVDSIFFINNLIDGGYNGFDFSGGTGTSAYGMNIVFDSNIVSNQYYHSVELRYIDITSFSHNTILTRSTNINSSWRGLDAAYINGPFIGNRIIQRITGSTPNGFYIQYHNNDTLNRGLIANNEVILKASGNMATGMYLGNYNQSDVINNSIFIGGTGIGIRITSSTSNLNINNNNIVTEGTNSYAVYMPSYSNQWKFSHNNIYIPLATIII